MRRFVLLGLCLCLLTGCAVPQTPKLKQYTATFLELFDTVTTVVGRAESEEIFTATANAFRDELERYHRLFDIYHDYEGLVNLKTVNDMAATAPVIVDAAILDLLSDCKTYFTATGGVFNPAMGSVLRLWHDAREDGLNDPAHADLPDEQALREAAKHVDPDDIILDREASTVFFADPALQLDVGAIAKGWAVQRACERAPAGLLVSVGGNVCATGPKDAQGTPWAVGIRDPRDSSAFLHVLNITAGCVVTSGSYQRGYVVDGRLYHHIIDPATLYPGERWTSVSVVCPDSGLADVLSTALFLLDQQKGQALLDRFDAEAMWVDAELNKTYSPGFRDLIRN